VDAYQPWADPTHASPLATEPLVRKRWEQRQILLAIPDQTVARAFKQGRVEETKLGEPVDFPLVESGLRIIGNQLIEEHELRPILKDVERAKVATSTFSFLNQNHQIDFPLTPDGNALKSFIADTNTGMKERVPLDDKRPFLEALALVLIWADLVSGDGYRDPRLPTS
jgi:hypothetical protein